MKNVIIRADEAPAVIFKKCADAEAEVRCQLFFNPVDPQNPTEDERLHYETSPVWPKVQKVEIVKNSPGWYVFFLNAMRELRP